MGQGRVPGDGGIARTERSVELLQRGDTKPRHDGGCFGGGFRKGGMDKGELMCGLVDVVRMLSSKRAFFDNIPRRKARTDRRQVSPSPNRENEEETGRTSVATSTTECSALVLPLCGTAGTIDRPRVLERWAARD